MQLIISYDWAEGQWLAGQEGQQPTHLALRSIHVELEKRKRSKRQRQSFFRFSFLVHQQRWTKCQREGIFESIISTFPPFSTTLPTSSSIILSKGVEPSVKERGSLDSVFADVCLRNQTGGKRGIWRKMGAVFGLLSNWGTRGGTRGDLREWL